MGECAIDGNAIGLTPSLADDAVECLCVDGDRTLANWVRHSLDANNLARTVGSSQSPGAFVDALAGMGMPGCMRRDDGTRPGQALHLLAVLTQRPG